MSFDPIFRSSSHVHLTTREVEKKKRLNDVPDDEEEHDEELLSVLSSCRLKMFKGPGSDQVQDIFQSD